jgi:hypothetical protein
LPKTAGAEKIEGERKSDCLSPLFCGFTVGLDRTGAEPRFKIQPIDMR